MYTPPFFPTAWRANQPKPVFANVEEEGEEEGGLLESLTAQTNNREDLVSQTLGKSLFLLLSRSVICVCRNYEADEMNSGHGGWA